MYIFAEPVTEEEVAEIQSNNDAKIQEFESRILGLKRGDALQESQEDDPSWAELQANVQEAMDKDELGLDESTASQRSSGDSSNASVAAADDGDDVPEDDEDGENEDDAENEEDEVDEEEAEEDGEQEDDKDEDCNIKRAMNEHEGAGEEPMTRDDVVIASDSSLGQEGGNILGQIERLSETSIENSDDSTEASAPDSLEPLLGDDTELSPTDDGHTTANSAENPPTQEDDKQSSSNASMKERILPFEKSEEFKMQADTPFIEEISQASDSQDPANSNKDILAMTLTVRNKANNAFVLRPETLTASDTWSIEYSLTEVPDEHRAWALYEACQARRRKKLDASMREEDTEKVSYFIRKLRKLSEQGREWRKGMDEKDSEKPVRVLGKEAEESLETKGEEDLGRHDSKV